MASDDRKRAIMAHLEKTSDNAKVASVKRTAEPALPSASSFAPPVDVRKQAIMSHVSASSREISNGPVSAETRKQRILEHLRLSQS